eukprot:CAMPEP_0183729502 /NCGR_PEP_ID=MMETSP0737-20130205/30475_1 /TAXON_ID=385413 /ORGANISM="Thalassiosira miniscula, Strain CCMP1093" /LENGTH=487 /DNA_ID=CAMNT_0025961705 /DNA_START=130 /DNA_END=1590 /DNA_ORIENTATION=-
MKGGDLEKAIPVDDIRQVNANSTSTSSDASPEEVTDTIRSRDSSRKSAIASEEVRRRRKRCMLIIAFLPFLGASAALGIFVFGTNTDSDSYDVVDGQDAATSDGSGNAAIDEVQSTSNSTTTPAPLSTQIPTEEDLGATTISVSQPTTTSVASTLASPKEPLEDTEISFALSEDEQYDSATSRDEEDETMVHGNLRHTTSPTSSPTSISTSASPTSAPTTAPTLPPSQNTTQPATTSNGRPQTNNLVDIGNDGSPSTAFPLSLCQGDCDNDDDCEGSAVCFKRDTNEAVPGCSGVGSWGTDYCYAARSFGLPLLADVTEEEFPLSACQGDCDGDDDCEGSLLCFQRDRDETVPGCSGEGTDATDYCFDRRINYLYSPQDKYPLGLCEGSCGSDSDCEDGLQCFLREWDESVPGCPGEGTFGAGYCFDHPESGTSSLEQSSPPTDAPTASSPTVAPTTSSPSNAPSDSCIKQGDICPEDKNQCCSGWC